MSHMHIENLVIYHENHLAIADLSLKIEARKATILLGPSGSGKTSLLRALAGLLQPKSGRILLQPGSRIGYVSQQFDLFPHFSVRENCVHPQIKVLGRSSKVAKEQAEKILASMGLKELQHRSPAKLSGGQKQRVAIARALAMDSDILLLDEPTSALDPKAVDQLVEIVNELTQSGLTVVVATHDLTFARALGQHFYLIQSGRIVDNQQAGSIKANSLLANYLGGKNKTNSYS